MRRLLPFAIVLVLAAGCSDSRPHALGGQKTVSPLPSTVVGTVPKEQTASVPAQYKGGDPVAGKQVFATAGCKGCHTLKDSGATGTVGPNLDTVSPPPSLSLAISRLTKGGGAMPSFTGTLSAKQIANVAAYVVKTTGGNPNG